MSKKFLAKLLMFYFTIGKENADLIVKAIYVHERQVTSEKLTIEVKTPNFLATIKMKLVGVFDNNYQIEVILPSGDYIKMVIVISFDIKHPHLFNKNNFLGNIKCKDIS